MEGVGGNVDLEIGWRIIKKCKKKMKNESEQSFLPNCLILSFFLN